MKEKKILDEQCNPMYVQGVRTIMNSDPNGPQRFGRPHRFTNATGCWQQHLLMFRSIMKSNGWSPDTAALQLFAHLDGEALQVALLMPDRIRER